jgi:DNA (cytosine-5)-methyltransferase 1
MTPAANGWNGTLEPATGNGQRSNGAKSDQAIPFRQAFRFLLARMASEPLEQSVRAELPAIISHWLQNPRSAPLLVAKDYGTVWRSELGAYVRLNMDGFARMKSRYAKSPLPVRINFGELPFPPVEKPKFTFIDLFAGIGGFRLALQEIAGKCVFSCESDKHAQETYFNNYGEIPFGDIRQFTSETISDRTISTNIPDHDVLAAGFPCQPFSRAGVSARNSLGQQHGFSCEIEGTLFFDLMRIAKVKRPRVLFLENVKNLKAHDGGRTFDRIRSTIEDDLGYSFSSAVIDSSPLVPQRRKRCYIVCFRDKRPFEFPAITGSARPLLSALEDAPSESYTLSEKMWQGHIRRTQRNLDRGTGFTAFEADLNKPANTLVARYYKDGKECLIPQTARNPRMLTPRECARLQGFPEQFRLHPWDMQAYRQFGNSVALPVVQEIANRIRAAEQRRP